MANLYRLVNQSTTQIQAVYRTLLASSLELLGLNKRMFVSDLVYNLNLNLNLNLEALALAQALENMNFDPELLFV
jgi:TATA-box binding protein (TBP) (component of TFIID and TFIIIB)